MKLIPILLFLFILFGCQHKKAETTKNDQSHTFYVGTYTSGDSKGIYKCTLDDDGVLSNKGLVATTENPAFLTFSSDKKFLVCVNSNRPQDGSISSFKILEDSLSFLSKTTSGGPGPCHVSANNQGFVVVTNYTDGSCCLLKIDDHGILSELMDFKKHTGSGASDRQDAPHPHSAWFEPNGDNILMPDLGTNEVWVYNIDTTTNKLQLSAQQKINMAPGAGPRHLTFHPNKKWAYVVNELDCTVTHLEKQDNGTYSIKNSISTLPVSFTETNTCADIHISNDGKFLYASNRGHNSLAIYKITKQNGNLVLADIVATLGDTPRNFSISPNDEYVIVANQNSNNIISFKRDQETGLLSFVSKIDSPSPVCILFTK